MDHACAGRAARLRPTGRPRTLSPGRLHRTLQAHWETWRPYTLAYPGLVGLAGAATQNAATTSALIASGTCTTLGWLGAHYLGDYFDRDLDAVSKPQRPLPSGRLHPGTARVCGALALLTAAGITLLVRWPVVVAVLLALAGIVAYSRLLKHRGLWGNVARGMLMALAVLYGAAVAAPTGEPPSWQVASVALIVLLHDTATNIVGTLRDVAGDRAGGYRTLPVQRGLAHATRTATALYAAALLLAAGTAVLVAHRAAYLLLLIASAVTGAVALVPLLRSGGGLGPRAALHGHEVLVGERLVLAAAVLAGSWGLMAALAALLPLLAVSLVSQHRMRAKHEFPLAPITDVPDAGTPGTSQGHTSDAGR